MGRLLPREVKKKKLLEQLANYLELAKGVQNAMGPPPQTQPPGTTYSVPPASERPNFWFGPESVFDRQGRGFRYKMPTPGPPTPTYDSPFLDYPVPLDYDSAEPVPQSPPRKYEASPHIGYHASGKLWPKSAFQSSQPYDSENWGGPGYLYPPKPKLNPDWYKNIFNAPRQSEIFPEPAFMFNEPLNITKWKKKYIQHLLESGKLVV